MALGFVSCLAGLSQELTSDCADGDDGRPRGGALGCWIPIGGRGEEAGIVEDDEYESRVSLFILYFPKLEAGWPREQFAYAALSGSRVHCGPHTR